jgi:NADH-quinone oxidoreductase subunit H
LLKEIIIPNKSNKFWFLFGPIFTFYIALLTWSLIPIDIYSHLFFNTPSVIILLIALFAISSHGIIISAWFSNNKFGLLGAIRSLALAISYGLSISLIFFGPCYLSSSFNLQVIALDQQNNTLYIYSCLPLALLFWITILTEIKKIPFDVSESESELGSGFMIEYSASNFALFIISEYIYIIVLLNLFIILFLGGAIHGIFIYCLKLCSILLFYFVIRSILPNFRFDQIMVLHWKYILPASLIYLLGLICITTEFIG